jgi:hypothetical protein
VQSEERKNYSRAAAAKAHTINKREKSFFSASREEEVGGSGVNIGIGSSSSSSK